MSEDAKSSLQMVVAVISCLLLFVGALWLFSDIRLPGWLSAVGSALAMGNLIWLGHGLWRRRYREIPNG